MHTNGMTRAAKRQRNGFNNGLAAPLVAALKPEPKKKVGPQSWSTALEVCRKAEGLTIPAFIERVFKKDPNVQANDVRRWESARALPSIAQCQKIRVALPRIYDYDDLLPLDRRALNKPDRAPEHPVPVKLEGWPGPKVATFGEALLWCRSNAGMSQPDLGILIGCRQGQISRWERHPDQNLIMEMYRKVCQVFPALEYAPRPNFSQRFQNAFKGKGHMEAERVRMEAVRHQRLLDEADEERKPQPAQAPKAPVVDRMELNKLGAAYGVAKAHLAGLRAEEAKLKGRHEAELTALGKRQEEEMVTMTNKIADAVRDVREAEERVDREAADMHGRAG